jgi:predicted ferric reductase
MSQINLYQNNHEQEEPTPLMRAVVWVLGAAFVASAGFLIFVLLRSPSGAVLSSTLNQIFALDSVQVMWYITRAAGLTAYVLLWLSTAWGLAVSSKILDLFLHRTFTYDFHQFISLLAIGFIFLHIAVLMADRYLPYTLAQILLPFLSPYRPLWVGIGVIGFYLTLLVTVTFYLRSRIGVRTFRAIHGLSLIAYLAATVHGFFAGTDSPLLATELIYAGTFLVTVFLTSYWLIGLVQKKLEQASQNSIFDSGSD